MPDVAVWRMPGDLVEGLDYATRLRERLAACGWTVEVVDVSCQDAEGRLRDHDRHVLTGGELPVVPLSDEMERILGLARRMSGPESIMVGICLGAQILAAMLAGNHAVRPSSNGLEVGLRPVRPRGGTPIVVPQFHYHEIDPEPLKHRGLRVLASNDHSAVQAFSDDHGVLALQFHPELDVDDLRQVIRSRSELLNRFGLDPAALTERLIERRTELRSDLFTFVVDTWLREAAAPWAGT